MTSDGTVVSGSVARRFHAGRWWAGVFVGAVVMVPTAWLLSHAAMLPFLLGVFFFALFGLVVGAVVYRTAAPGRPYSATSVLAGTTLIVVGGWGFSVFQEARDAPRKLAEYAARKTISLGGLTVDDYRASVTRRIGAEITGRFPPGGTLGYVRWVLSDGKIPRGMLDGVGVELSVAHRGWVWLTRVSLCVGLLAFGVGSQTFLLRRAGDSRGDGDAATDPNPQTGRTEVVRS